MGRISTLRPFAVQGQTGAIGGLFSDIIDRLFINKDSLIATPQLGREGYPPPHL